MLDQLVESKSNAGENTKRGGFLLTTGIILTTALLGAWMYSLFAKDFGMGGGDLELSTLVAPVPVPESEPPPPPEPEDKPKPQQTTEKTSDVVVRKDTIASVEDTKVPPKDTLGQKDVQSVPKDRNYKLGTENLNPVSSNPGTVDRGGSEGGTGVEIKPTPRPVDTSDDPPPVVPKPTPKPTPPPAPKRVSLGVVNGKARNLVKPPYPAAAKAVRASGAVNVSVQIDENGNVTSASAVSGHPLLKQAAESAARASKFSPTVLNGQPVKVSGVIVYNFVAQ